MKHRRDILFSFVAIFLLSILKSSIASKAEYNPRGIPDSLRPILTDDLATWQTPKWVEKEFPYTLSGYDYFNRPIWILEFGKWDILKVIKKGGKDFADFDKYHNQCYYRTTASRIRTLTIPTHMAVNASAVDENQSIILLDFKDYPASQVASLRVTSYLRKKLNQLKRAYDHVTVVYVINVSRVSRLLIEIIKPTIADIYYKAEFYGTDKNEWMPVLQTKLPRDQIPYKYGGYSNHTNVVLHD